jgi:RNA-binding protein
MNNKQEKTSFKKLSHYLKPLVQIGKKGITESLLEEIKSSLLAHELIKLAWFKNNKANMLNDILLITKNTGSELILTRGNKSTIYLKREKDV